MEVRPNQAVDNSSTSPQQHRRRAAAAASKQPVSATNAVDTTSVTQRLQKELMALMMSSGDLGVSAFPEGESIFTWIGTIKGGEGTMYEGLSYKLSLRFPLDYPFKPPQVKFETMCFHPNVDQFGNICLDILQDKWSSAYDCRTILLSVQSLLGEPNPESPLNTYAAALWNNKEDYRKMVQEQYFGGEARYFRQNILNLSVNLGLDVSAQDEKERGRIRSFEEQEFEAFKRVKRELFRDMPYLLIIDNLETEREWWEGKDLHDLIPRNTGGTHVIITTRLPKVMTFDMMQLPPLPLSDAMILVRGRKKKDYSTEELEYLRKFDEKSGRLSFGLWIIGSLLSELPISPSALFEAVNQVSTSLEDASTSPTDEQFFKHNPFLMKILCFCFAVLHQVNGRRNNILASRMLLVGAWFAPSSIPANLLATAAKYMPVAGNRFRRWTKCLSLALGCCGGCGFTTQSDEDCANLLVKLGLARRANGQNGCWIQFHPITQAFAKRKECLSTAKAAVLGIRKTGNPLINSDHLWATAFLVFGFKSEPPIVQLKAIDMVMYIKKTALPLAIRAFTTFSRCNSALELLKVCTNVLEEVEKSFVSQIQDWCQGSLCWRNKLQGKQRVDEYVWQDVTLLKATLLETRAKLLLRGGHFDGGEELCRTCISIRTVMLGHNHAQTLAAQETLANLVRMRSKI